MQNTHSKCNLKSFIELFFIKTCGGIISGRSARRNYYKLDNATNQSVDWIRTEEFAARKGKRERIE